MKRISAVFAGALMLGTVGVVAAPSAWAVYTCTAATPITNTTINDSVVVPAGETCIITNSTVNGTVTANSGSTLDIEGSTINGNVIGNSPAVVKIGCVNNGSSCTRKTLITGSVTVTGAQQDGNYICESNIQGSVTIKNSVGNWSIGSKSGANGTVPCAFDGTNNIGGSVTLTGNQDYIAVDNNNISGSVYATCNTGGGEIVNNVIKGSLTARNTPLWTVSNNQVTGSTTNTTSSCPS